ncbi:hypothetical protein 015DV004_71 [Bacillus phage 015DV004]|nr:hypothetical protein 015DV004_71 [Bacillus phage 015DV004]
MSVTVKVHAYCGFYTKLPKWNNWIDDWRFEPDECGWGDVIELDWEDWTEGSASVECPSCGAELTQCMDHFELVDIPVKEGGYSNE